MMLKMYLFTTGKEIPCTGIDSVIKHLSYQPMESCDDIREAEKQEE
jgi:hypothetical protein